MCAKYFMSKLSTFSLIPTNFSVLIVDLILLVTTNTRLLCMRRRDVTISIVC